MNRKPEIRNKIHKLSYKIGMLEKAIDCNDNEAAKEIISDIKDYLEKQEKDIDMED